MALEEGKNKMSFVVTPLNLLGKQNVEDLEKAGLSAIAVTSKNANAGTFKVKIISHTDFNLTFSSGYRRRKT
jgi:hypothetical protein